jgi:hypothetical protein
MIESMDLRSIHPRTVSRTETDPRKLLNVGIIISLPHPRLLRRPRSAPKSPQFQETRTDQYTSSHVP